MLSLNEIIFQTYFSSTLSMYNVLLNTRTTHTHKSVKCWEKKRLIFLLFQNKTKQLPSTERTKYGSKCTERHVISRISLRWNWKSDSISNDRHPNGVCGSHGKQPENKRVKNGKYRIQLKNKYIWKSYYTGLWVWTESARKIQQQQKKNAKNRKHTRVHTNKQTNKTTTESIR